MTAREYIEGRLQVWGMLPTVLVLAFLAMCIPFLAGLVRAEVMAGFLVLVVFGLVLSFVVLRRRFRCPSCSNTLTPLAYYNRSPALSLPKKVTHCPLCGVCFDDELSLQRSPPRKRTNSRA